MTTQIGEGNAIYSSQNGFYNTTEIMQEGNYNFSAVMVAGGEGNNVYAGQYGESNISNVYMDYGSDYNNVSINQGGLNNTIGDGAFENGIYISGDMNFSSVNQMGAFNSAKATVYGSGNVSGIIQH